MKTKTALCSTGHGTGVLMMKAPSWPVQAKQRARKLRKFNAWLGTPEGRRAEQEQARKAEAIRMGRERAKAKALVVKPVGLLSRLRRMFTRAT